MRPIVTADELRTRAGIRAGRLGQPPDTARDQVHWRERRESAALELAASADWDPVLLAQTLSRCKDDDPVKQLLLEALGYCPQKKR